MFIQTEETPNPASLKFIPGEEMVAGDLAIEFKNKEQAKNKSPLAEELFLINGVESIFLGSNFVTITKTNDINWDELKSTILTSITDFFISGKKAINEIIDEENTSSEDSDIVKQIKELIEIKVRPAVAMDGGDIIYRDFIDGVVMLELKGACSGCPSSTITLKNGIENMLKHYVPEVVSVEQVDS
jgi:Fe-S cluster biogenesis protein NfuA